MLRVDRVVADMGARVGLEREGEGDRVIRRADAVVLRPKGQRTRPTPEITIDTVKLPLQTAALGVEIMLGAEAPVVVQPVKNGAGDEVGAGVQEPVARIPMADAPAPPVVWHERNLMECHVQFTGVDVITQLGFEDNPRTWPEREVGIKVV